MKTNLVKQNKQSNINKVKKTMLPYIIKGVVWLVSAPFKAIKKVSAKAKTNKKTKTKRQVKK